MENVKDLLRTADALFTEMNKNSGIGMNCAVASCREWRGRPASRNRLMR